MKVSNILVKCFYFLNLYFDKTFRLVYLASLLLSAIKIKSEFPAFFDFILSKYF